MRLGLHLSRGMKVGLYGGSFDPAHAGHRHAAKIALTRLGLDRVVWLVSPGNPLKQDPAHDLAARMRGARAVARNPRFIVSGAEARLGARYTVDTIRALKRRYAGVRFVWIMGADSLAGFHRWKDWGAIFHLVPVAVVPRPGHGARARLAPAPRRFAGARFASGAGRALPFARPPAWIDLAAPVNPLSSTALRAQAGALVAP